MLYVRFGQSEKTLRQIDKYFRIHYKPHWIESDLARDIIEDVDKTQVISGQALNSPIFGAISPKELSGGTKALLIMLNVPNKEHWGSGCGNNCAKWILRIADKHDLLVILEHDMEFPQPFEITVVNSNRVINTMREMDKELSKFLEGVRRV